MIMQKNEFPVSGDDSRGTKAKNGCVSTKEKNFR